VVLNTLNLKIESIVFNGSPIVTIILMVLVFLLAAAGIYLFLQQ